MKTIKRAFLYVTRKKGKSILLFCILLIMATLVLTGISIQRASNVAQKNLRETFGGEFQAIVNFSESNPYFKKINDKKGNVELYTEFPITQKIIDTIMTVNGIKRFDAETKTFISTELDIFHGNVPLKEKYNNQIYARTVANTEYNSFFQSETAKLLEGNHITGNESNVAVISKDLADKNNLTLGDFISLQADQTVQVKIIGIYNILKPDSSLDNIVTYEKVENQIFIDIHTLQNLFKNIPVGFDSVIFTVNDPAQLHKIISEVNNLPSIDWRAFTVTENNQTYLDAAAPLQKLQTFISSIIFIIILVSIAILSLILTMWERNRIHEIGIFLSLGIGKVKIISQYLIEVFMIAVFSFGCSYFTSNAIANQLANELLLKDIPTKEEQGNDNITINTKDGYDDDVVITKKEDTSISKIPIEQDKDIASEIETSETTTATETTTKAKIETNIKLDINENQMNVTVGFYNIIQLYFIGSIVIILSVGISSLTFMRLNPREILSKMS